MDIPLDRGVVSFGFDLTPSAYGTIATFITPSARLPKSL